MESHDEYPFFDNTCVEFLRLASCFFRSRIRTKVVLPQISASCCRATTEGVRLLRSRCEERRRLNKHPHTDRYGKSCCVWRWPTGLIIYDRHFGKEIPNAKYAPWLPSLTFVNKQILGEVSIWMLQTNEWFELKYEEGRPFKIVAWFADFLFTFQNVSRLSFM